MEIIKKVKIAYKFKVVKPFLKGKILQKGEEIELAEAEAEGMVRIGRVIPSDLPAVAVYIAVKPFYLPGATTKYEAKSMELVSLKAEDALRLMLQGFVIPKDDNRWRPCKRRLASQADLRQKHHTPNLLPPIEEAKPKIRFTKNTTLKYPDGSSEKIEKGKSGWFGMATASKLVKDGCAVFIE